MDDYNLDIAGCRRIHRIDVTEDIILRLPNVSTIERFFIAGGGKADDIYNK